MKSILFGALLPFLTLLGAHPGYRYNDQEPVVMCATTETESITINTAVLTCSALAGDDYAGNISVWFRYALNEESLNGEESSRADAQVDPLRPGRYTAKVVGLLSDTTYYYKACAAFRGTEVCGEVKSFKTKEKALVSTGTSNTMSPFSARIEGFAALDKVSNPTGYGIICTNSQSASAQVKNGVVATEIDEEGKFVVEITTLRPSTTYYYRAFVTTEDEVVLGEEYSFQTDDFQVVTTPLAPYVKHFSAGVTGSITTWEGNSPEVSVFVKYAKYPCDMSTFKQKGKVAEAQVLEDGNVEAVLTGLAVNTRYAFAVYAVVNGIEYYGKTSNLGTLNPSASVEKLDAAEKSYDWIGIRGKLNVNNDEDGIDKSVLVYMNDAWYPAEEFIRKSHGVRATINEDGTFSVVFKDLLPRKEYCFLAVPVLCGEMKIGNYFTNVRTDGIRVSAPTVTISCNHWSKASFKGELTMQTTPAPASKFIETGFYYKEEEYGAGKDNSASNVITAGTKVVAKGFETELSNLVKNKGYLVIPYVKIYDDVVYGRMEKFRTKQCDGIDLGVSMCWGGFNSFDGSYKADNVHYYAWGETKIKSKYQWSTYKHCRWFDNYPHITKYKESDHLDQLTFDDDKPCQRFKHNNKSNYRMPTLAEWRELIDNCTWEESVKDGKKGILGTSKINGNTYFLPACGYRWEDKTLDKDCGYYWTSTLCPNDVLKAGVVYFKGSSISIKWVLRAYGCSIRHVTDVVYD